MPELRTFPSSFLLKNICSITSRGFELKSNPDVSQVDQAVRQWFKKFNVYDEARRLEFLTLGRFDLFAALSFPEADTKHLETCLAFFFWAFSTDDLSDEGELMTKPDDIQAGHNISMKMLENPDGSAPKYPYAAMLHDILQRIKATASPGTYVRFIRAFEAWSQSQVKQAQNRHADRLPSVSEFILMRRATIGAAMVEAMVEYSLDIKIPDYVFQHPIMIAMSDATSDIMTWPNDLCSFNKEQADGDLQNFICCVMMERDIGLQEAIDVILQMIDDRVSDYIELKSCLPSFGAEVDAELARYHKALEYFVQGTVVWYYKSPRYFRGLDVTDKEEAIIQLFPKSNNTLS
ncbi:isoprenoid synthase domain-containing protein [Cyathus striatus]|nr:isoprenoid synthase domain-containing protein [Cyathus striatus]